MQKSLEHWAYHYWTGRQLSKLEKTGSSGAFLHHLCFSFSSKFLLQFMPWPYLMVDCNLWAKWAPFSSKLLLGSVLSQQQIAKCNTSHYLNLYHTIAKLWFIYWKRIKGNSWIHCLTLSISNWALNSWYNSPGSCYEPRSTGIDFSF